MTDKLRFDAGTHTYWLGSRELPSVTRILGETGVASFGGPPDAGAMERGTAVHEACRFLDERRLDLSSLSDDLTGYVQAWQEYRAASPGVKFDRIEQPIYHLTHLYAGTPDRSGTIKGGDKIVRPLVVDIKTGAQAPWHALQVAAYAAALGLFTAERHTVYLKPDGRYKVVVYESGSDDYNVFIAALTVWRWKKGKK